VVGLNDPERLAALDAVDLLDSPAEEQFDRITRVVARALRAPVSLVTLVDAERQFFKSAVGAPEGVRETPLSHSFCQHVAAGGDALVIEDAREVPLVRDNLAIPDLGVIAYAGVPIVVDGVAIGSLCAIDRRPRTWSDEDVAVLRDMAEVVTAEIVLRDALRRETRIAESLQFAMLPDAPPELDGARIAARYRPSKGAVGGDFYDVVRRGDEVLLTLGDVVGKGIGAASAAAQLRHAVRGFALEGLAPAELVVELHELVVQRLGLDFATGVHAELTVSERRLRWAGAGHLPLVLVEDGRVEQLAANQQPMLGAASRPPMGLERVVGPGAMVGATTDGLVERPAGALDEGLRALGEIALRHRHDPERLCDAALGELGADASDDVALLAVRVG
jgi:hypothetical protein